MSAELLILSITVIGIALTYLGILVLRRHEHARRVQTYQGLDPALMSTLVRPTIRQGFLLTLSGGLVTAVSLVSLMVILIIGIASTEVSFVIGLLVLIAGTIVAAIGEYSQHRAWVYAKKLQH